MNADVVVVLAVLAAAAVLFVTGRVRYDAVGLSVAVALALLGAIPMERTIEGFANPAVVTIAAVLVLSGGLYRTGVANFVGRRVMGLAGRSPLRVTALLMLTAGLMSGVMNNIAATALLLPVALDIAKRLEMPPSRLLIPLAWASLLGGMTTLIGTGPNILVSEALVAAGEAPVGFFDFTPVGAAALAAGIVYMVFFGARLLPARSSSAGEDQGRRGLGQRYGLAGELFTLRLPHDSLLHGRTLVGARIGRALAVDVLAVRRGRSLTRAPDRLFTLRGGDELVVKGRRAACDELRAWGSLLPASAAGGDRRQSTPWAFLERATAAAEVEVAEGSELAGRTLREVDFSNQLGVRVLGSAGEVPGGQDGTTGRADRGQRATGATAIEPGGRLLVVGPFEDIRGLVPGEDFASVRTVTLSQAAARYGLDNSLLRLNVPERSGLAGVTLAGSRLSWAFGLTVIGIERAGEMIILPGGNVKLQAGDRLAVDGDSADRDVLMGLQALEPGNALPPMSELESDQAVFAEVTLAPSSTAAGKSLRDLDFRRKFGLSLLSVWRGGVANLSTSGLRGMALEFGDALLLYGRPRSVAKLSRDSRFLVMNADPGESFRLERAAPAAAIMLAVVGSAALGLMPIYVAALGGSLLMIATGCIKGSEVYQLVDWRVIVLLAGMIALGLAMEESGTAELIATEVVGRAGAGGSRLLLAALFLVCGVAAQVVPTAVVAVLVTPVALSVAAEFGLSPHALLMVVALGSSCAFLSPFGHPVNLLVMGVGGYRVTDYTRAGLPLFVVLGLITVFVLPLVWPLR